MLASHYYYVAEGHSNEGDKYGIYDGRGQSKTVVERSILRKAPEEGTGNKSGSEYMGREVCFQ